MSHWPPILVKDKWLHIESTSYRKGGPLPEIDFTEVLALGIDPTDILVNLARQVEGLLQEEGLLWYYEVRPKEMTLQVEDLLRICRERFVEVQQLRAENKALREMVATFEWANEMACENTPTTGCECPGCCTARERADRGEAGP